MEKITTIGFTKDAGFQAGVRRTFNSSVENVWNFLLSHEGLNIWLGEIISGDFSVHQTYRTKEGIEGIVRILKPYSHIRMSWKRKDWENASTLQVRVIPSETKTTISFHQEKLMDGLQREEMKMHWEEILSKLSETDQLNS